MNLKSLCAFILLSFGLNSNALEIVSYNIRNFDHDVRSNVRTNKEVLVATMKSLNADVFGLEEIVNLPAFQTMVKTSFPEYDFVLSKCGGAGNQKLGFLFKRTKLKLKSFVEDARLSADGQCNKGLRPAAIGNFTYLPTGANITGIVVHLKAGGRQANEDVRYRQYGILSQIIREIRQKGQQNIFVLGDFNTTDYVLRNQNYTRFIEFIDNNQMIDFTAEINCTAYWFGGTDDNVEESSILDHVMVTQEMYSLFKGHSVAVKAHCEKVQCRNTSTEELGITYKEVSDHCPLQASLKE